MTKQNLTNNKIYKVMDKICNLYEEEGYRRNFMKNEFKEQDALDEILEELKELEYVKIKKNSFNISHLGIRYLKNLLNEYDNMYDTKKISVITFLVSSEIALIAVFVSLAEYEQLPILLLNFFILIVVIWVGRSLRKF